ncbi:MAG: hypothetical protein AAF721_16290 [Myxococcota bacterium]
MHASRRRTRRIVVVAMSWAAVGLPMIAPRTAEASEVRTVSRTIGEGYMVRAPGPEGTLLSRRRVVQYVGVGVYGILPPKRPDQLRRDPEDGQLRVQTSMRLRHDFGTFTRRAGDDALLQHIDGRQIDLLYGYLEGERLGGWVDLRAGRQFEMSGLDFYAFDGGWLRVRTPAHLAVEAFGGFSVDGTAVFGFPTFELDGTQGTGADRVSSPIVGTALSLADIRWLDARVAYRRTFTPSSLGEELVDSDGSRGLSTGDDQEIVSASVALRLAKGRLSPFAAGRVNLGTARLDDVSAGLTWSLTDLHSLRGQYLRTIPAFDLDSIFNVFSVTPFEDIRLVYQVKPSNRWTLYGRFQGRIFRAETTSQLATEPETPTSFGGGGGGGAAYRIRRLGVRADGFGLGGEGGTRVGGSVDARTHVWWDRVAIDTRAFVVYYRDQLTAARRGHSVALQVGTNLRLAHGVYFNIVGEQLFTPFYRSAFRAFGVLSMDWAFRAGGRS